MTGKVTEIREYLSSEVETATQFYPEKIYRSVSLRLEFDDSSMRLTPIGRHTAHHINFPIEVFPPDVKIGDDFTLYFERKK